MAMVKCFSYSIQYEILSYRNYFEMLVDDVVVFIQLAMNWCASNFGTSVFPNLRKQQYSDHVKQTVWVTDNCIDHTLWFSLHQERLFSEHAIDVRWASAWIERSRSATISLDIRCVSFSKNPSKRGNVWFPFILMKSKSRAENVHAAHLLLSTFKDSMKLV